MYCTLAKLFQHLGENLNDAQSAFWPCLSRSYFLEILILISVALGVFNLLPLPGLDGGRIFFVGINAIRRRDMNPALETKIHMVGIMVLLMVLVVVTFNDIKGIFFKKMG